MVAFQISVLVNSVFCISISKISLLEIDCRKEQNVLNFSYQIEHSHAKQLNYVEAGFSGLLGASSTFTSTLHLCFEDFIIDLRTTLLKV